MDLEINGTRIHLKDAGEGARGSVVLLHGFPFSHAMWTPQIEAVRPHRHVIAPDVRGLGRSEAGDGQFTLELFVDDLLALLDHLRLERVVLAELSMGGYIALRAVELHPERVAGLVLCDTKSEADGDEAKVKRAAAIRDVKARGVESFAETFVRSVFAPQTFERQPALVEAAAELIRANTPLGIAGCLLAMAARTDTTASLARIGVPTLVLVGEHDTLTPPAQAVALARAIPGAQMHVIPNAAHLSNWENPAVFNEHLLAFLGRCT